MSSLFPNTSNTGPPPPPPPPPPPSDVANAAARPRTLPPKPPVASNGPPGAYLVELIVYNGSPFKDHWAYFVRSHKSPDMGAVIHATGDVRNGFKFEIKRSYDFEAEGDYPTTRIPLQWVDARHFDERAMLNDGVPMFDTVPVCGFEVCLNRAKAPGKTLNSIEDATNVGQNITQKNCQSWLIEAADLLVQDHMFDAEVAVYLHAIEQ